jgi:hypothetical protein
MQKSNDNIRISENSVLECSLFFVHVIVHDTALFERGNPFYKREIMNVRFFWNVTPFSWVNGYQCFRGSCHFLLQYRRRKELSLLQTKMFCWKIQEGGEGEKGPQRLSTCVKELWTYVT